MRRSKPASCKDVSKVPKLREKSEPETRKKNDAEDASDGRSLTMRTIQAFLLLSGFLTGLHAQCFKDVDSTPTKKQLLSGMDDFFRASNRFSIRLLQALNVTENTFFSPFSIWSSMILVFLGSRGSTEKELENLLGLQDMDKILVAHSYHSLKLWFTSKIKVSAHSSFKMANNLFLQKDIEIRSCLLQFLDDNLAYVDFNQNPELARIAINYLVRQETNNKIADILPPFSIHSFTQMVITSTMYFEGTWMQQFQPHATKVRPFYISSLDYILVDMMTTRDTFLYTTSDELQCAALEMPYMGRSLTMVIMLPRNKAHGVKILTSSLNSRRLYETTEDMFPREVMVVMPKFQIHDGFQLSPVLFKMGFRDLSNGMMNLTGFTRDRLLHINAVYHKAFINVDEKGTEATGGTVAAASRRSRPDKVTDFIVDRPFLFYIRENHSGSILFLGVVKRPN